MFICLNVTPRMRCVSRNRNEIKDSDFKDVTPRMRCVSRN